MKKQLSSILSVFALVALLNTNASAQFGTWSVIASNAPNNSNGDMLLLTDGSVLVKSDKGGGSGYGWDKLTPDIHGSYVNGTWSSITNMNYDALFFATQVLPDGKVFSAGGEYGAQATHGEVYDPVANTWKNTNAVTGGENIYDGNSEILATGVVLVGPQAGPNNGKDNLFYTEGTNNWSLAPNSPQDHDEAAWLKLPDYSILFIGINSTNSTRYIPGTNTWVNDATVPQNIYDQYGEEAGGAYMLPNGKAVFFGANGKNVMYTPSGTSSPGTWSNIANFPTISGNTVGQVDAAGCMMINGKILLAVSPVNTSHSDQFRSPFWFVEYDYTTNSFAQVTSLLPIIGADSVAGVPSNFSNFLQLPNGQVLFGVSEVGNNVYWVYTPSGSQIAQGVPTISKVYETSCGTYKATGKLFNGISEGAGFGDDWQMSTNYPIIRITDGTNVYYAKTTFWNRVGAVQTDSLADTVQFTFPMAVPAGTYSLVVTANGFASKPTLFTPYAATATATAEVSCNGGTDGKATAVVQGGNTPYTYKWSNGTSTVSTSNPTAAILTAGTYTLTVTDKLGCTTTTTVTITQPLLLRVTAKTTPEVSCNGGSNGSVTASPAGGTVPYTYLWSAGGTAITQSGLSAGTYTIVLTDKNGCTATATTVITQPAVLTASAAVVKNATECATVGSATVTPGGGTAPYKYAWTGGNTNANATGLSAGVYTVTVTDKNGCTNTATVTITAPAALSVVSGFKPNGIYGGPCDGKAYATVSGGTSAYTYLWTPGGNTTDTAKSLCIGNYCCKVTDKNGCIDSICVVVTGIENISNSSVFTIYPNPNNGSFTIQSSVVSRQSTVEVYNVLGEQILNQSLTGTTNQINLNNQSSGVYLYRIHSQTGEILGTGKFVIQK